MRKFYLKIFFILFVSCIYQKEKFLMKYEEKDEENKLNPLKIDCFDVLLLNKTSPIYYNSNTTNSINASFSKMTTTNIETSGTSDLNVLFYGNETYTDIDLNCHDHISDFEDSPIAYTLQSSFEGHNLRNSDIICCCTYETFKKLVFICCCISFFFFIVGGVIFASFKVNTDHKESF